MAQPILCIVAVVLLGAAVVFEDWQRILLCVTLAVVVVAIAVFAV